MIQVYTGKGKGKTTAAFGLALRAAGNGLKVYICQFVKHGRYGEVKALKDFSCVTIEQFGKSGFIKGKPCAKDITSAKAASEKIKDVIKKKKCDLLILDEINWAMHLGLVDKREVLALLRKAPRRMEIVLTGRHAPKEILGLADLVSEMKEIKHYFHKGILARRGIEF